jgi:hypothetical protein
MNKMGVSVSSEVIRNLNGFSSQKEEIPEELRDFDKPKEKTRSSAERPCKPISSVMTPERRRIMMEMDKLRKRLNACRGPRSLVMCDYDED